MRITKNMLYITNVYVDDFNLPRDTIIPGLRINGKFYIVTYTLSIYADQN